MILLTRQRQNSLIQKEPRIAVTRFLLWTVYQNDTSPAHCSPPWEQGLRRFVYAFPSTVYSILMIKGKTAPSSACILTGFLLTFIHHCFVTEITVPVVCLSIKIPLLSAQEPVSVYNASFGQFFTHSMHKMHSVPFLRFLELSVISTSIGQTCLHFPQVTHLLLSHLIRNREK